MENRPSIYCNRSVKGDDVDYDGIVACRTTLVKTDLIIAVISNDGWRKQ